jgi:hypothetical protein
MSLDLYVWLAWRLHTLSWAAIHSQFGAGFQAIRHFRPRFLEVLGAAVAAYPEAKVQAEEIGIVLHPSKPPISRLITLARA